MGSGSSDPAVDGGERLWIPRREASWPRTVGFVRTDGSRVAVRMNRAISSLASLRIIFACGNFDDSTLSSDTLCIAEVGSTELPVLAPNHPRNIQNTRADTPRRQRMGQWMLSQTMSLGLYRLS